MVPQNLNMVDEILRAIRIFVVQKNGELSDKFGRNINLICENDPQGMNMKIFTGKQKKSLIRIFSIKYSY